MERITPLFYVVMIGVSLLRTTAEKTSFTLFDLCRADTKTFFERPVKSGIV